VAPVTVWGVLLGIYVAWMGVFMAGWMTFCALMRRSVLPPKEKVQPMPIVSKPIVVSASTPLHVQAAPAPVHPVYVAASAAPAPVKHADLPVVVLPELAAPAAKPVPDGHHIEPAEAPQVLPHIRVMPRTPDEIFA